MQISSRGSCCPSDADLFAIPSRRAQGMPGCWPQPHGPPAERKAGGIHHRSSRTSGIPCTMALRLIRTLPGDRAFLPPSPADHHRQLGISVGMPEPYDFVVRGRSFVGMIGSRCDQLRPPHPALHVRDDREAPLLSSTGPNQHSRCFGKIEAQIFARRDCRHPIDGRSEIGLFTRDQSLLFTTVAQNVPAKAYCPPAAVCAT